MIFPRLSHHVHGSLTNTSVKIKVTFCRFYLENWLIKISIFTMTVIYTSACCSTEMLEIVHVFKCMNTAENLIKVS